VCVFGLGWEDDKIWCVGVFLFWLDWEIFGLGVPIPKNYHVACGQSR